MKISPTERTQEFIWVTNPQHVDITFKQQELDDLFRNFLIVSKVVLNLGSGRFRYQYVIETPPGNLNHFVERIRTLIDEVSYYSLEFTWRPDPSANPETVADQLEGLKSLLIPLLSAEAHIDVTSIDVSSVLIDPLYSGDRLYKLSPLSTDDSSDSTTSGRSLYFAPHEIGDIFDKIQIENLVGYESLSSDPLVFYILRRLDQEKIQPSNPSLGLTSHRGIILSKISLNPDPIARLDHDLYKESILQGVIKYRDDGYFVLTEEGFSSEEMLLAEEIGKLWQIETVDHFYMPVLQSDRPSFVTVFRSRIPLGADPVSWMRSALLALKFDLLPSYTLGYPEMAYMSTAFDNRARLQYAAVRVMAQMAEENPLLVPFIPSIYVGENLSVTGMFGQYEDVEMFTEKFRILLNQGQVWSVFDCGLTAAEINRCLVQRWVLHEEKPQYRPLLVEIPFAGRQRKYLVVDTIDTNFELPKVDDDLISQKTQELQNYYRDRCHGEVEPISMENIEMMGIVDLLSLIITDEMPSYCFFPQTMLSLEYALNPITQKPFSRQTLQQLSLSPIQMDGIYSVGPMPGLFKSELPLAPLVPPCDGELLFSEIDPGKYFYVQLIYSNGMMVDLFDINTSDRSKLIQETTRLWQAGWFLNPWCNFLCQKERQMSILPTRYRPILAKASINSSYGEKALRYLEQITLE